MSMLKLERKKKKDLDRAINERYRSRRGRETCGEQRLAETGVRDGIYPTIPASLNAPNTIAKAFLVHLVIDSSLTSNVHSSLHIISSREKCTIRKRTVSPNSSKNSIRSRGKGPISQFVLPAFELLPSSIFIWPTTDRERAVYVSFSY